MLVFYIQVAKLFDRPSYVSSGESRAGLAAWWMRHVEAMGLFTGRPPRTRNIRSGRRNGSRQGRI